MKKIRLRITSVYRSLTKIVNKLMLGRLTGALCGCDVSVPFVTSLSKRWSAVVEVQDDLAHISGKFTERNLHLIERLYCLTDRLTSGQFIKKKQKTKQQHWMNKYNTIKYKRTGY